MALRLYGDGNIENVTSINTAVSATELGYLDGVTGDIQGQINDGGLVHIDTQSFSGSSNFSINNVFSSEYKNYYVFYRITSDSASTVTAPLKYLQSDGSAYSSATYAYQGIYANFNTSVAASGGTGATSMPAFGINSSQAFEQGLSITSPFTTEWTIQNGYYSGSAYGEIGWNIGQVRDPVSFTGISVTASGGNIQGTVSVYGYRNS